MPTAAPSDPAPSDPASPGPASPDPAPSGPVPFDVGGYVRRCRRTAELSQRGLAMRVGTSHSLVARVETGRQDLTVGLLVAIAGCSGLRVALLDASGREVAPMRADAVRDRTGRRFPAHVDLRHGDEAWHGEHRYDRDRPTWTFSLGFPATAEDHQRPDPRDDLEWRRHERVRVARRRQEEEYRRRVASGEVVPEVYDVAAMCECPPGCEELLVGDDPAGQADPHVPDCPCRCDIH